MLGVLAAKEGYGSGTGEVGMALLGWAGAVAEIWALAAAGGLLATQA